MPVEVRSTASERAGVLARVIEQNDCPDCGGDLEHGQHKENAAAVCTDCGTPRAQVTGTDR